MDDVENLYREIELNESRIEARTVVIKQAELPRPKENEFVNEEK